MERAWLFDHLAVTVERVDFIDPAVAHLDDARERGVRLELRLLDSVAEGTVYVSPSVTLHPAVYRVDLLESKPGAADRMHWHPAMAAGEPGKRTFDPEIPADPLGWVTSFLDGVGSRLADSGIGDADRFADDIAAIAVSATDIVDSVRAGLEWARQPWPDVAHDDRGMARV
jgi:hypothetical protein